MIEAHPRRTGRTTKKLLELMTYAIHNNDVHCMFVTPNAAMAKQCYLKVLNTINMLGNGIVSSAQAFTIILVNGSRIEFASDSSETKLYGKTPDCLLYDHTI